ncbi:MAG: DNA translocase FtsK 4TM domain-containing protein [Candidatus Egerieousia sp.]
MKKPRKSRKSKDEEEAKKEMEAPKKKEGFYLIVGLVFLAAAVYTLIALISYIFTWAQDQSTLSANDVLSSFVDVENGGGKMGLVWANFLISKLFGLGAFIIPFFFFGVALFCLKIKRVKLMRLFFITIFGCILLSVLFSFIFSFTNVDRLFGTSAGGSYGYYVNDWLKSMIGVPGTAAILTIAVIGWLIIINRNFIRKISNKISSVGTKVMETVTPEHQAEEEPDKNEITTAEDGGISNEVEETQIDIPSDPFVVQSVAQPEATADTEDFPDDSIPATDDPSETLPEKPESGAPEMRVVSSAELKESQTSENEEAHTEGPVVVGLDDDATFEVAENVNSDSELLGQYTEEELQSTFDPRLELSHYEAPTLDLLDSYSDKWYEVSREEMENNKRRIVSTLATYKIGVSKVSAKIGPTVTLYEVVLAPGVRVSQVKRLEEDIQLSLAAKGVRVVTIPGSNAVGIEVANEKPSVVSLQSCMKYLQARIKEVGSKESEYALPIAMGKTVSNDVFTFDLAKCPHLLMAGATGQGKSVGINALLTSILFTKHPSEVKLVLIDPKKVELSLYSRLEKYFLASLPDEEEPVITDTKKVIKTLRSLCKEMDARYDLLKAAKVRNIKEYNEKFLGRRLSPAKGHRYLPYIVLVIDEYCDLIMTAGKDIEIPITRLAQLARAIGIHLVIATQRPTATVITGNIKANFPTRIAFYVRSSIDSRTILDESGANQLIGRGDMLYGTGSSVTRLQCALIETKEIDRIVDFISSQVGYATALFLPEVSDDDESEADFGRGDSGSDYWGTSSPAVKTGVRGGVDRSVPLGEVNLHRRDEFFDDAAQLIVANGEGSASFIQRKMNLGYNRSSRLIDQLQAAGIVGEAEGSKPRKSLIPDLMALDEHLKNLKETYGK